MKNTITISLLVVLSLLVGCDPPEMLFWTPDGKRAAVLAPDGLHICDAEGKLSGSLVEGITRVAWFSDSKQALLARSVTIKSWKEAEPYLDEADAKTFVQSAEALLRELAAYKGDVQKFFEEKEKQAGSSQSGSLMAELLYLRDHHGQEVKAKLNDADWKMLTEMKAELCCLQRYEIGEAEAKPGAILTTLFTPIVDIRISSRESAVAYVTGDGNLLVAPCAGGRPVLLADQVSRSGDWTSEGRSLVYIRANGPAGKNDLPRLGSLRRMEVLELDGSIKKDLAFDGPHKNVTPDGVTTEVASAAENLAWLLFDERAKVRSLPDGRYIFSSEVISLPVNADAKHRTTLFALRPGEQMAALIASERQAELSDALEYFQLSPDGRRIAAPGSGGQVAIINLADGKITEVQPRTDGHKLRMMPTWRGNDELTFAIQNPPELAKDRPAEVYLAVVGKQPRCISKSWAKEVVGIMRLDDNPNQPAPEK